MACQTTANWPCTVQIIETYAVNIEIILSFTFCCYRQKITNTMSTTRDVNVTVLFNNETFWLLQKRMAELFNATIQDISYLLIQINESGELQLSAVIKKNLIPSDNCENFIPPSP